MPWVLGLNRKLTFKATGKKALEEGDVSGHVTDFEITKSGAVYVTVLLDQKVGKGNEYKVGSDE